MNKGGFLIYKCRQCGEEFTPTGAPDLLMALICVSKKLGTPSDWGGVLSEFDIHNCKDGKLGVADLIGGKYYKEN